ncbi:MAG: hypothetical protein EON59_07180 [Alphaproteobacteria bacterium]|nr:MAG: hypothetical protein EON59_07180 [Alphaproteobacteria bacterium]
MSPNPLQVEVRDHALWVRHIQGDPTVQTWLESVPGGAIVHLEVDGVPGDWRKMSDGSDGRPTQGLKPVTEPARGRWHALQAERGKTVSLQVTEVS